MLYAMFAYHLEKIITAMTPADDGALIVLERETGLEEVKAA